MRYQHVVAGGTFDGLHKGHQAFLMHALNAGSRLTIGLTSDAYVRRFKQQTIDNKKQITNIRSFEERKRILEDWLDAQHASDNVEIVAIDNIYGPAHLGEFDAIVVTANTRQNALDINKVRVERGLHELVVIDVPLVPADDAKPISSTRIREGEIDRDGHLMMPDALRPELQRPLGTVLVDTAIGASLQEYKDRITVTVGDVATKTLFDAGVIPTLSIVDFLVNRRPSDEIRARLSSIGATTISVASGPGYISKTALDTIAQWGLRMRPGASVKTVITVDGEEDLLTLVAIGHAPLGAVVYYGQPAFFDHPAGLVEVLVTPEKKREVASLLRKFVQLASK